MGLKLNSTFSPMFSEEESRRNQQLAAQIAAFDPTMQNSDNSAADAAATSESYSSANAPLSREQADRLYEERIEDEYAKHEGGA